MSVSWEAVAAISAAAAAILALAFGIPTLILGIRADRRSTRAESKANHADQQAASAHEIANQAQYEGSSTSDEALAKAQQALENSERVLAAMLDFKERQSDIADATRLAAEIAARRLENEQTARIELRTRSSSTSADGLRAELRARNLGPQPARDFSLSLFRNGELIGDPTVPKTLDQGAETSYEFKPRLGPYRSAIPDDVYRLQATYQDGNGRQTSALCFRFEGQGNEDRTGIPIFRPYESCESLEQD